MSSDLPRKCSSPEGQTEKKKNETSSKQTDACVIEALHLIPSRFTFLYNILVDRMVENNTHDEGCAIEGKVEPEKVPPRGALY